MVQRWALLLALAMSGAAWGQAYKWVDERGVTTYGERPPAGRPAKPVATQPYGVESDDLRECHTILCQGERLEAEKRRAVREQAERAEAYRASATAPVRGMDFAVFIRLQTGMSEGELLLRAGKPDHESTENIRHDIVKTYYYLPTSANPYITAITLRGGRIANIERTKKF